MVKSKTHVILLLCAHRFFYVGYKPIHGFFSSRFLWFCTSLYLISTE